MTPGLFQVCMHWLPDGSESESEGEHIPSPVFTPLPLDASPDVIALRASALGLWAEWNAIQQVASQHPENQTLADAVALCACAYRAIASQLREARAGELGEAIAAQPIEREPACVP